MWQAPFDKPTTIDDSASKTDVPDHTFDLRMPYTYVLVLRKTKLWNKGGGGGDDDDALYLDYPH